MDKPLWTVGVWGSLPNYCCSSCPYATLEEDKIRAHVLTHLAKVVQVPTAILTPQGKPVMREVVVPPTKPPIISDESDESERVPFRTHEDFELCEQEVEPTEDE